MSVKSAKNHSSENMEQKSSSLVPATISFTLIASSHGYQPAFKINNYRFCVLSLAAGSLSLFLICASCLPLSRWSVARNLSGKRSEISALACKSAQLRDATTCSSKRMRTRLITTARFAESNTASNATWSTMWSKPARKSKKLSAKQLSKRGQIRSTTKFFLRITNWKNGRAELARSAAPNAATGCRRTKDATI